MLGLHFVPDGVWILPGKDTVFQSHFVQLRPYRSGELIEYLCRAPRRWLPVSLLSRGNLPDVRT